MACRTGAGGSFIKHRGKLRRRACSSASNPSFWIAAKKIVPALQKHYGFAPGGRQIRFFEEHVHADEIHGRKGFEIVGKYCTTSELQALALKAVEAATIRRWRYMNGIFWFALHGKEDDTPSLEAQPIPPPR